MIPQLEIARAFAATRLRTFATRERLEAYQRSALRRHLIWVRRHVPFYRELDPASWEDAPLMDRSLFMEHFRDLNTAGIDRLAALEIAREAEHTPGASPMIGDIGVGLSSGTSSSGDIDSRGIFLTSGRERRRWAGTILAKTVPDAPFRKHRVALFLRANSGLYSSVRSRRLRFDYFDLATEAADQRARLEELDPTVIVAPPSRLRALAELRPKVAPGALFAGAEVLEHIDRQVIEHAFGRDVREIYQATEGFLGVSCPMGRLHLNEDILVVHKEYLDRDSGRFVPIITDFRRTTQPIVRYRLNDILRETTCTCGSVLQAVRVEGREDDCWMFTRSDGMKVPVFPDEVREVFAPFDLEHFGAHQESASCLRIAVAPPTPELNMSLQAGFERLFERHGLRPPDMTFAPYLLGSTARKVRRVTRGGSGSPDG